MSFYKAGVADILRCSQRDSTAVIALQEHIQSILKIFTGNDFHLLRKHIPNLAAAWYYLMTSVSNLQTLGEEYTGIIRISENGKIPTKLVQMAWLILYVGGEPLFERLLTYLNREISNSPELESDAKIFLDECLKFVEEHKATLMKLHHSIFYIRGTYYSMSNRTAGIRYVLVREWLQNNTFTQGFRILGNLSMFYILFEFIQKLWTRTGHEDALSNKTLGTLSRKMCVLCCENRKKSAVTPCGHIYCWDCIHESLSFQNYCPLCREPVKSSRIVLLQNYS